MKRLIENWKCDKEIPESGRMGGKMIFFLMNMPMLCFYVDGLPYVG